MNAALGSSLLVLLLLATITDSALAQSGRARGRSHPTRPVLGVASDLRDRLAKYRVVRMPFDTRGLKPRELRMLRHLVRASHYMESIFWRQSDPEGLKLYQSLAGSGNARDQMLRRFLFINGSRFDLLKDNEPFVGTQKAPPGRGMYSEDLTREEIEAYVKAHPGKKDEVYSPYTIMRRRGSELEGVPYRVAYRQFLEPAARELRQAAALSDEAQFAKFLRLRADALLSDDYYESDLAWMDLKDPKFDVIFGPYETYLDEVVAVKTQYSAAVLIRNQAESKKLALYEKYVPEIQEALPLGKEDLPSKRGLASPMQVMDAPFRAGDLRHGYQAVANNLPNDPRIHEQKGSKKTFFKNFMDARVNYVILPLARRLMRTEQAARATPDGYLTVVIMHEIAHGLGPAYARREGKRVDIREAIGPVYSALEESKATVVGLFGLKWMVDHGLLPRERLEEYYASMVAGTFRTVRFGLAEAHGRAQMMEFNYLAEQKAITREASGRYGIDHGRMPDALAKLAKELLEIEATGDRARAEAWFKKYETMPPELRQALEKTKDVPVDIDPVFAFTDRLQ